MKLTNHHTYDIDTYVMHGTIEMTMEEYYKAFIFLRNKYHKAVKNLETYTRDSLAGLDYERNKKLFSLGVTATSLIATRYHLKGYKNQNYGIQIT